MPIAAQAGNQHSGNQQETSSKPGTSFCNLLTSTSQQASASKPVSGNLGDRNDAQRYSNAYAQVTNPPQLRVPPTSYGNRNNQNSQQSKRSRPSSFGRRLSSLAGRGLTGGSPHFSAGGVPG